MLGSFCVENAEPIGECTKRVEVLDCITTEDDLLWIASWYDPALCVIGEATNCDSDHSITGDGTPVEDCYNVCVACPIGWYGRELEFYFGTWQCRDHGGAIKPTYGNRYIGYHWTGWYLPIDFMLRYEESLPDWMFLPLLTN